MKKGPLEFRADLSSSLRNLSNYLPELVPLSDDVPFPEAVPASVLAAIKLAKPPDSVISRWKP